MVRSKISSAIVVFVALATQAGGQGGMGGGMAGAGGAQGAAQGQAQQQYDQAVRDIQRLLEEYLGGEEQRAILTPGEYTEWKLDLKAGQVVIAEARSEAFDAAIEVVDKQEKVLIENDDRFPGDQRPLLLFRAPSEGVYSLRVRSWRGKAGGQHFVRFRVYDTMDLVGDAFHEKEMSPGQILVRVPMKAGQIKEIRYEAPNDRFFHASFGAKISPTGLPSNPLPNSLQGVLANSLIAPVDGDYYILTSIPGRAKATLRVGAFELRQRVPAASERAPNNERAVWKLPVKAGQLLRISTPALGHHAHTVVAEVPDFSKYSLEPPEANPFFPKPKPKGEDDPGPAFVTLPARARDGREIVVLAKRDAELWVVSSGHGSPGGEYTIEVEPAAKPLPVASPLRELLRIGDTDYYAFEARVGDVMTIHSKATGFASELTLLDPDLVRVWQIVPPPDVDTVRNDLIVRKPGRFLVSMSSVGGGGGGAYELARQESTARQFGKGAPASGTISSGDVHVWKFTATPDEPLLVRWQSSALTYDTQILQETGEAATIPLTRIDNHNRYGILRVEKPTTFLIVLIGRGSPSADYRIELSNLPGYPK